MKFLRKPLALVIGAIIIAILLFGNTYNGLVRSKAKVEGSWSQVETQYQRRFDLIPNLQSIVSGAAEFEKSTFTEVTQARNQFAAAANQTERVQAVNNFDSALSRLLVTVEAYPQLKATEAFRDFSVQLEGTENRIAVARRDYNVSVEQYNVYVRTFPRVIIASIFGYEPEAFFQSAADANVAPTIEF